MAKKSLTAKLKENIKTDMISKNREGNYIFRKGFFYTHGKTARDYQTQITDQLKALDLSFEVVDCGMVHKAFKGGASVKNQSHWWVEINIHE